MRFSDLLKLSLRMFKARAMRTILTILGMSVGIAAIIFLVSLGYGLQRTILERITTLDSLVSLDVTAEKTERAAVLSDSSIARLRNIPNVVEIIPVLELSGQAKLGSVTLDVGTVSSTAGLPKVEGLVIEQGRIFTETEAQGVVITAAMARAFNVTPVEILGKTITLTLFQSDATGQSKQARAFSPKNAYTIVGVAEGEENTVYASLNSLSGFPLTQYTKIKVKCSTATVLPAVRAEIEGLGFNVSSIAETVAQANAVFRVVQIVLMVFGMIALLVSAIGMFNTMTITLLERTEEIGIMKAIGASRLNISLMFLMESTIMGLLGALGGVGLGFAEGEILNLLVNIIASRFGGEPVDLFYSPLWFVGTVIGFGAFVGFMTGLFPARQASRIDTLDALRYK